MSDTLDATIARAEARERGEFIWESHTCAEHGYEGIPKCPWPDCPNGTSKNTYVTVRVFALQPDTDSDFYSYDAERIFMRYRARRRSEGDPDRWICREVAYLPHWIGVNDRLPAPNEGVIVQLAGSFRDRCLAYIVHPERIEIDKPNAGVWRVLYVGPDWKVTREPDFHHVVTYWQPVPPPATETKEHNS